MLTSSSLEVFCCNATQLCSSFYNRKMSSPIKMAVISFQSLPVATQTAALASMVAISLCSYTLFCVIYNLFFHPLRRFPGPLLAKVSGAWARVQNFYGRKAHKIHEAHIHYGIRLSISEALEILKCLLSLHRPGRSYWTQHAVLQRPFSITRYLYVKSIRQRRRILCELFSNGIERDPRS